MAAAAVVLAGRGDFWLVAVLLAVADSAAAPAVVVGLAGTVALERFGSAALVDLAGAQSVLGAAGWHGPNLAVAAVWVLSLALVAVCRRPAAAAVAGALGASLVAGPGFGGGVGDAAVHVGAITIGAAAGWILASRRRWSHQTGAAVASAAVATAALLVLPPNW